MEGWVGMIGMVDGRWGDELHRHKTFVEAL